MTPEHFSQTSSVPISSRAQASGSRSKKDAGRNEPVTTKRAELLGRLEWFVVNGQRHAAFDRLAVPEGRNKRRHPEIFRGRSPEPNQRRVFGNDGEFLQVSLHIDLQAQLDDSAQFRSHRVSRIMETVELGVGSDV